MIDIGHGFFAFSSRPFTYWRILSVRFTDGYFSWWHVLTEILLFNGNFLPWKVLINLIGKFVDLTKHWLVKSVTDKVLWWSAWTDHLKLSGQILTIPTLFRRPCYRLTSNLSDRMLWVERGEKYCSTELRAAICRLGRITNFPPDFMLVQASHPDFSLVLAGSPEWGNLVKPPGLLDSRDLI